MLTLPLVWKNGFTPKWDNSTEACLVEIGFKMFLIIVL